MILALVIACVDGEGNNINPWGLLAVGVAIGGWIGFVIGKANA